MHLDGGRSIISVDSFTKSQTSCVADQRIGGDLQYNWQGHVSESRWPFGVAWPRTRSFNPDSGMRELVNILDNQ